MDKETVIAIVRIVFPAVVSILGVLGITNVAGIELESIGVEAVAAFASVIVGAISSIYTGWKNNNVTDEAKQAQVILSKMKSGEI